MQRTTIICQYRQYINNFIILIIHKIADIRCIDKNQLVYAKTKNQQTAQIHGLLAVYLLSHYSHPIFSLFRQFQIA